MNQPWFVSLMEADFSDSNNPTIDDFFDMFTKDGCSIQREEFIACLLAMNSRLTSDEVANMFDAAGPNNDGRIYRSQFRKFLIAYHTDVEVSRSL